MLLHCMAIVNSAGLGLQINNTFANLIILNSVFSNSELPNTCGKMYTGGGAQFNLNQIEHTAGGVISMLNFTFDSNFKPTEKGDEYTPSFPFMWRRT